MQENEIYLSLSYDFSVLDRTLFFESGYRVKPRFKPFSRFLTLKKINEQEPGPSSVKGFNRIGISKISMAHVSLQNRPHLLRISMIFS
jgi:hypothetical protein